MISFEVLCYTSSFETSFTFLERARNKTFGLGFDSSSSSGKRNHNKYGVKALRRGYLLRMSQVLRGANLTLCELSTEQVCPVLRASRAVYTYTPKDVQFQALFFLSSISLGVSTTIRCYLKGTDKFLFCNDPTSGGAVSTAWMWSCTWGLTFQLWE